MSITETVSRFVVETSYAGMPQEAVVAAKRAILDTLGVALAGSREEAGRIVASLVAEGGSAGEAGVLGTAQRAAAPEAALVNGTFAHALDYDDVSYSMRGHPSAPLLPALLALGEKLGASGRQVIEAFVLGFEVECKLGRGLGPSHYAHGWHATSVLGTLGAAVGAAKLLALDIERTRMALGIAASMASGSRQNFGSMTKPYHVGHAARGGLVAALLAERGFTADADILDGPLGFGRLFAPEGDWRPEKVTARLGDPFDILSPGVVVKKYPCCFAAHRTLDAVFELVGRHTLAPEAIAAVEVRMPAGATAPLVHSRPRTGLEGKFSIEYCLAAALLDGGVKLATFTDDAVRRPAAQALLRRVQVAEVAARAGLLEGFAEVVVVMRDGTRAEARVEEPRGSPAAPLTWDELVDKYCDCAQGVLSRNAIGRSAEMVSELEGVSDVRELMALLCPRKPAEVSGRRQGFE